VSLAVAASRSHPIIAGSMTDDPVIDHIERFRFRRGPVCAERRNGGYTLLNATSGNPVARLKPGRHAGNFEVMYWSAWRGRWISSGPLGRTVLSLDGALRFIDYEDIFWVHP
jgi:hypothetical protein